MDYMNRTAPPPFGGEAGSSVSHVDSYMNGRIGDLVTLDQNSNGSPDHVGIIVAFRSDGVPLVDAHNNDRYHSTITHGKTVLIYFTQQILIMN